MFYYIRDPGKITEESFKRINALGCLSEFEPQEREVAARLIHTCGEPDIIKQLVLSENAIECGIESISRASPVLCDVEMVRQGINRNRLKTDVLCFINSEGVVDRAKINGETRTMTALEYWSSYLN